MNRIIYFLLSSLLSVFLILGASFSTQAQDQILYYSGEVVSGKVIDITDTEVVYVVEKEPETEIFIIDKSQVKGIIYEDGKVLSFKSKTTISVPINVAYKNAIKLEIPSLFFNNLSLTYERSLINRLGLEVSAGLIGIGFIQFNKPREFSELYTIPNAMGEPETFGRILTFSKESGYFLKIGPKFTFTQKNSIVGGYVKPEFIYSSFRANGTNFFAEPGRPDQTRDFSWRFNGTSIGLIAKFGVQVVRKDRFLFDVNVGFGVTKETDELTPEGTFQDDQLPSRYRSGTGRPPFRYTHVIVDGRSYMIGIAAGVLL